MEPIASTECNHDFSFGLAKYRGSALTTGSYWGSSACNVKTEIYDFENDHWNDAPDYPYARFSISNDFQKYILNIIFSRIVRYATASTPDSAFIIGGWDGSTKSDLIARFQNNEWSQYGTLHRRRAGPGSVTFGNQTLIIGGWTDDGR